MGLVSAFYNTGKFRSGRQIAEGRVESFVMQQIEGIGRKLDKESRAVSANSGRETTSPGRASKLPLRCRSVDDALSRFAKDLESKRDAAR